MSLTTHVIDTVKGRGAAGMVVEVHCAGAMLAVVMLDDSGRAVLLPELDAGAYQILFNAGDYLGIADGFYNVIPVRFNVDDPTRDYHVPLILSPFGYSTYRGG
jgi:5-hydroxyisourate hydrolase